MSESTDPTPAPKAYVFLTVTALCWGCNTVFGRLAVGEVSPMALVMFRWLTVVILLMVFARRPVIEDWPALRHRLPFVLAMGALGFTAFNGLFYGAAHSTTAGNMGIIQGSIPVFVLIGAFALYRTPVTALQFGGVVLTMIGVIIVASGGDIGRLAALAVNFGDMLMVAACFLYAGYTVALRQRPAVSAMAMFTVMAGAAFVTSLPLAAAEAYLGQFMWPTPKGWLVVAMVALLPSFLAQTFFMRGVELIGPGRAGVFVNLVPVFASILAVVFLAEPFELYHAAALALVLGGIWISERGKRAEA